MISGNNKGEWQKNHTFLIYKAKPQQKHKPTTRQAHGRKRTIKNLLHFIFPEAKEAFKFPYSFRTAGRLSRLSWRSRPELHLPEGMELLPEASEEWLPHVPPSMHGYC